MTKRAPHEATITDWLASQKEAMLALLSEVVNIDSGSYDKAGVDAVGQRFIRFFEEQGLTTAVEPNEASATPFTSASMTSPATSGRSC